MMKINSFSFETFEVSITKASALTFEMLTDCPELNRARFGLPAVSSAR
jgi:hypothetical protein